MRRSALLLLALGLLVVPRTAGAHGTPPALEFYGDFGTAVTCQRAVARALRQCFDTVSRLQFRCASALLDSRGCDESRRDELATAATQRARASVGAHCSEAELIVLGYLGLADAQLDVAQTCTQQADATTSLVFGPAMFTGTVEPGPGRRDQCLAATARVARRVANAAVRRRSRAFLQMGSHRMTLADKNATLAQADASVGVTRAAGAAAIDAVCTADEFRGSYGMEASGLLARLEDRADCVLASSHVQSAILCPTPECGNHVVEAGEQCDDGNVDDDDSCSALCQRTDCTTYSSTFELIQQAIFVNKGCTSQFCHDSALSGGLDLRPGHAYASLVDTASQGSPLKRVARGDIEGSFLFAKLAAGTFGQMVAGSPMPSGGLPPLTEKEIEAVRSWIYHGAPESGVVEGTADLLDACLPPPDPIEITPPPPPAAGTGVQIRMPPVNLSPQSETEVCFAAYYDFTGQVPAESLSADGSYFRYKRESVTQDPLSHHLVIQPYGGDYGPEDPSWGSFACRGGEDDGQPCDPASGQLCGPGGVCATAPVPAVACLGYGPPDQNVSTLLEAFAGVQETTFETTWAPGVFAEFPLRGIIIWDSHSFNVSPRPGKVEAWVNFEFSRTDEQLYPVQRVVDVSNIFIMNVPPFEQREYCGVYEFDRGTKLFDISSHTHRHGKRFRIWDPQDRLIYHSTHYNDPVQLVFEPPLVLDSEDAAQRRFKYCSLYDNGMTDPKEVKRASMSPPAPPPFPSFPCAATHCAEGKVGERCSGSSPAARDRSCDSSAGSGDGRCDACNVTGGVTTEDEMFVFLATYYTEEPAP